MKHFLTLFISAFVFGFIGLTIVEACVPKVVPSPVCDNGEHIGNPHCIEPTVVPTTEPTVTPEVTVTPEASPSATPTDTPSTASDGHSGPDGLGCAVHDCSQHIIPAGAPATGRGL